MATIESPRVLVRKLTFAEDTEDRDLGYYNNVPNAIYISEDLRELRARQSPLSSPTAAFLAEPSQQTSNSDTSLGSSVPQASAETAGASPDAMPGTPQHRVREARRCLQRALAQLNSARNLKTEIKIAVTSAVKDLYYLVKGAEFAKSATPPPIPPNKSRKKIERVKLVKGGEAEPIAHEGVACSNILLAKLEEQMSLIRDNGKRLSEMRELMEGRQESENRLEALKDAIERQNETLERATYASVAAGGKTRVESPEPAALHSVVVSSRDEIETGDRVLEKIRKVMKANEGWVTVERVRKGRDRKIIMSCRTQEERNKVQKRIIEEAGDCLVVEIVKNKDPLLVLKGVLLVHSDTEVLAALRNQNRGVFGDLKDEDNRMMVKYKKKARNPLTTHYVLSVSPAIWKRAIEARKLHVDLQRVSVEDQSPLIQCTRCLGYGHTRKFCSEPNDLCSGCGDKHLQKECPETNAPEHLNCINCARAKLPLVQHNAFSSDCPIRRKWDAMARAAVAYC